MEELIGTVKLFTGTFTPRGWMACKGQMLAVNQYHALFSILGTQYGGDGRTTFALPDIPPLKAETGTVQYIICVQGLFPTRS